jgi:hypothetical protein
MTMVQKELLAADSATDGDDMSPAKETRQPFPVKVYEMLEDADSNGFAHIVSWNHQGTGFMVHKKDLFIHQIVPQYFNQTKYKSFQRQLSLYGFQRITVGPNKGLRHHEKLRRGCHDLVCQMKPVGYKPRGTTKMLEHQKQQIQDNSSARDQMQYASSSSPMTVIGDSSAPTVLITNGQAIPTVISSSSLDKEHTVVQVLSQIQTQLPTQQLQQAKMVSPGAVSEGEESSSEDNYSINDEDLNDILEQGLFEGMSFFLMNPTQEVLQEYLPAPPLAAGGAIATSVSLSNALPPPAVMDAELKKAYEIGYQMALSLKKKNGVSSNEEQHQEEGSSPMPPSPGLLLEDCVDALDFHAANIAATTGANL